MDEQTYNEFKQERLNGMPITDIAIAHKHGHSYYHRNGYVKRFNEEYPNFPETRGRKHDVSDNEKVKHENPHQIDEAEYQAFASKKLAGQTMEDILYNSPHGQHYYYVNGYVARFNREHPEYRHNKHPSQALTDSQIYNDYIEYHRKGMHITAIAEQLNTSVSRIKRVISIRENSERLNYTDHTLANQVKQAQRPDKFKIIDNFRRALIADYGTTLMDVPNDEPRLKELQLANQSLTR